MDPLDILRDHTINRKPVTREGDDLVFSNHRINLNTLTSYRKDDGQPYNIGSLWFCLSTEQLPFSEYYKRIRDARTAGSDFTLVSNTQKNDLLNYLHGRSTTSKHISLVATVAPTNKEKKRPREEVIRVKEPLRNLRTRTSVLLSTKVSLEPVLHVLDACLTKEEAQRKRRQEEMGADMPVPQTPTHMALTPATAPVPAAPTGANSVPIIIVPSALTSILCGINSKEWFEQSLWVSPTDLKNKGTRRENPVTIMRERKHGQRVPYLIYENTTKMTKQDWGRVVAVFAQGPAWQFKGWPWPSATDVFMHIPGFYLHFEDEKPPENIKQWSVKILSLSKHKRHRDGNVLMEIWSIIDNFCARKRPNLNVGRA